MGGFSKAYKVGNDGIIVANNAYELSVILDQEIEKLGINADLNHIDVHRVKNMECMFSGSITRKFNGDISKWNVSNVETMIYMFENSDFNGDISKWDVSKLKDVGGMFTNSKFTGDISHWIHKSKVFGFK